MATIRFELGPEPDWTSERLAARLERPTPKPAGRSIRTIRWLGYAGRSGAAYLGLTPRPVQPVEQPRLVASAGATVPSIFERPPYQPPTEGWQRVEDEAALAYAALPELAEKDLETLRMQASERPLPFQI